jgi:phosphate-selective porin OprO and OprP
MRRIQVMTILGLAATLGNMMPGFAGEDNPPSQAGLQEQLRALEKRVQILEWLLKSQAENGNGSAKEADPATTPSPTPARVAELDPTPKIQEKHAAGPKDAEANQRPVVGADANGFSLKSEDENFNLKVRAHFHADNRYFADDPAHNFASTLAIRRARLLFEGTLAKYFDFKIMPDFAGSRLVLQDVYMDARILPQIRLRVGKFKTPFGLERLQQPVNISFVERALPNNLVPNRDLGIQVHGDFNGGVLNYMVGVFNGVPDGESGDVDQDTHDSKDYAGRIFAQPFLKKENSALRGFGIGIAATTGVHRGTSTASNLRPYLTTGQSTFFRYLSDGTIIGTTIADGRLSRLSPQAYYYRGPFGLLTEHVVTSQGVRKANNWARVVQKASQVGLTYVLTGEDASYRGVVPRKALEPGLGTWGAFEVTARYSELNVDDKAFPVFANPRISARKAQALVGGLNWYFNRNVKFVANYEQTFFKEGGPAGNRQTERVIVTRFQLAY